MDEIPWWFVVMFWSGMAVPVLLAALLFVLILAHTASVDPHFRPGVARALLVVACLLGAACLPGIAFWTLTAG